MVRWVRVDAVVVVVVSRSQGFVIIGGKDYWGWTRCSKLWSLVCFVVRVSEEGRSHPTQSICPCRKIHDRFSVTRAIGGL